MTLPPKPRCVLFDLDGTLVDTAPDLAYAANCVRADAGLPPLPAERYRRVASAGARGLLKVGLDLTPEHADYERRRQSFLAHYREHLARESRLFPGMAGVLAGFATRGIAWGIVTNKPQWLTEPLLKALGLDRAAAVVVGAMEGLAPKPSPEGLLRACDELDLAAPECAYVGDDLRDVAAARAAAMPSVAAAWGYLGEGEAVEHWGADAVAQRPEDLLALFP